MNMHRGVSTAFAAVFATIIVPWGASGAQTSIPVCPAPFASLLSDDVFHAYAVHVTKHGVKPVPPKVKTGRAHQYRSVIRDEARHGPDFADHYTIVRIGCGAATVCLAITDAETGNVYFPPELMSAEALLVDTGSAQVDTLTYRRNSRLLAVVGSPNEQAERAGISYYVWQFGKLKLVRFLPAFKLCGLPETTKF